MSAFAEFPCVQYDDIWIAGKHQYIRTLWPNYALSVSSTHPVF